MDYEKWVQKQLVAHGENIPVDGDWGRLSIAALKRFQKRMGLAQTGVTDSPTLAVLKRPPTDNRGLGTPTAPTEKMPPWMSEMYRRMGLHEIRDNAVLIAFLKIGRYLGNPKDLPWCGDAVESCIAKTLPEESLPSNPFFAQNWKTFGRDVESPIVGSIGVIKWSATSGHVGFVAGVEPGRVLLLGANQQNSINISSFDRKKFIAFRHPSTYPVRQYPALKGTAIGVGSKIATR